MGVIQIMIFLLFIISPCVAVGQMGGVVRDLGRRNGALAQNTIKCRDGFMVKFSKFLSLKKLTKAEFYQSHQVEQCKVLTHYWNCMRKEKSYKKPEHRVCFFFLLIFRKKFFFLDFSETKKFVRLRNTTACQI